MQDLLSLFRELYAQDQMLETISVHLRTRLNGVAPVRKADEGEALR